MDALRVTKGAAENVFEKLKLAAEALLECLAHAIVWPVENLIHLSNPLPPVVKYVDEGVEG